MWRLDICVLQKDKKGTDQILGRIYVQKDRGGYGSDAGCITKVRRIHKGSKGLGLTSDQGSRGALQRSYLWS